MNNIPVHNWRNSPKGSSQSRLRIFTINMPSHYIEYIDKLVKKGVFASRSEFCRDAINEKLQKETLFDEYFTQLQNPEVNITPPTEEVVIVGHKKYKIVQK
jgi:Arc/MetJ-type ribon-helix-helix transcriptional regulator